MDSRTEEGGNGEGGGRVMERERKEGREEGGRREGGRYVINSARENYLYRENYM